MRLAGASLGVFSFQVQEAGAVLACLVPRDKKRGREGRPFRAAALYDVRGTGSGIRRRSPRISYSAARPRRIRHAHRPARVRGRRGSDQQLGIRRQRLQRRVSHGPFLDHPAATHDRERHRLGKIGRGRIARGEDAGKAWLAKIPRDFQERGAQRGIILEGGSAAAMSLGFHHVRLGQYHALARATRQLVKGQRPKTSGAADPRPATSWQSDVPHPSPRQRMPYLRKAASAPMPWSMASRTAFSPWHFVHAACKTSVSACLGIAHTPSRSPNTMSPG